MNANRILTRSFHVLYKSHNINVLKDMVKIEYMSGGSGDIYIALVNDRGAAFSNCFIKIFTEVGEGYVTRKGALVRTRESESYSRVFPLSVHPALSGKAIIRVWKGVLEATEDEKD